MWHDICSESGLFGAERCTKRGNTMVDFYIRNREHAEIDKVPANRRSNSSSHARQVVVRDERGRVAGWVIAPVSRAVFGRERGTVFMDRP